MTTTDHHFWKHTALEELTADQWEALCDGCGKCCLHRLEEQDTREIQFTNVCCRFLEQQSCRCTTYRTRLIDVPDCISVTHEVLRDNPRWLPASCAYRLLAEGGDLAWWHPLVSGDPQTVIRSGNAVAGRVVSELEADPLEYHIVDWLR